MFSIFPLTKANKYVKAGGVRLTVVYNLQYIPKMSKQITTTVYYEFQNFLTVSQLRYWLNNVSLEKLQKIFKIEDTSLTPKADYNR